MQIPPSMLIRLAILLLGIGLGLLARYLVPPATTANGIPTGAIRQSEVRSSLDGYLPARVEREATPATADDTADTPAE